MPFAPPVSTSCSCPSVPSFRVRVHVRVREGGGWRVGFLFGLWRVARKARTREDGADAAPSLELTESATLEQVSSCARNARKASRCWRCCKGTSATMMRWWRPCEAAAQLSRAQVRSVPHSRSIFCTRYGTLNSSFSGPGGEFVSGEPAQRSTRRHHDAPRTSCSARHAPRLLTHAGSCSLLRVSPARRSLLARITGWKI